MSSVGTFIVVFLVVGVLSFLIIPVVMGYMTTRRFTRRFESLVRAGHIDPILVRTDDGETQTSREKTTRNAKVSVASLYETWIDIQSRPVALTAPGECIGDDYAYKPISVSFKTREPETPVSVRNAILTTREQRREAAKMHANLRIAFHQHSQQLAITPSVPLYVQHRNLDVLSDTKSENTSSQAKNGAASTSVNPTATAATVRMCVFILMPSADNPKVQKKRVSTSSSGLAVTSGISSGIQRTSETKEGVQEAKPKVVCEGEVNDNRLREEFDGEGRSQPPPSQGEHILQTQTLLPAGGGGVIPTLAMGVLTSNLEDVSEITKSHTDYTSPSLVSLEHDEEPW
ncbi:SubName: Full=Uncharacterized protein {ECO:0000313/EMBL:CCA70031.1} [Serendipita indica DSM 11827]|nr:SubName: Full=Uncharacterized protein {ECO:0000313/EMBL:CCA70031.1} [Serendipita indica DSM 11827]